MGVYKDLRKVVSATLDAVVDKTTTQAQKSRLVTVMRNEEKIANNIYMELGKYLYSNLREEMPLDILKLCVELDESKERMSRAQQIYRDVIRQEHVNREINKTEVKDNFDRIKEPIVAKAKDTVDRVRDTAKDTAVKVKETAAEKADVIKHKADRSVSDEIAGEVEKSEVVIPTVPDVNNDNNIVKQISTAEINTDNTEVLTVGQGMNDRVDVIETAILSGPSLDEDSAAEVEEPHDIFNRSESAAVSGSTETAAEVAESGFVPESESVEQDFQRNVPVDIINEKDFEQDEPEVKPLQKNSRFSKAMKLRRIITKKSNGEN